MNWVQALGVQYIQMSTKPTVSTSSSSGLDQDVLEQPSDELKFQTGQGRDDSGFLETADGSLIEGSYEFSIISEVVPLKFGKEFIDNLSCDEYGSINIKLTSTYSGTTGSVKEMYHIGTLVSVDETFLVHADFSISAQFTTVFQQMQTTVT